MKRSGSLHEDITSWIIPTEEAKKQNTIRKYPTENFNKHLLELLHVPEVKWRVTQQLHEDDKYAEIISDTRKFLALVLEEARNYDEIIGNFKSHLKNEDQPAASTDWKSKNASSNKGSFRERINLL